MERRDFGNTTEFIDTGFDFESAKNYTNEINDGEPPKQNVCSSTEIVFTWYCLFAIYPVIGTIGMAGNTISCVVLVKTGLKKTSNVLLLTLAIADMLCLLNALNIPRMIYYSGATYAWKYSYNSAFACYIAFLTIVTLATLGSRFTTYLTVLITLERVLAILFPLHFSSIVTPTRIWFILTGIVVLWTPWNVFHSLMVAFHYDEGYGGYIRLSELQRQTLKMHDIMYSYVINPLSHIIPISLVVSGCIIISIKIRMARKRR